jgi:RNA polymerase-binding protein DksA
MKGTTMPGASRKKPTSRRAPAKPAKQSGASKPAAAKKAASRSAAKKQSPAKKAVARKVVAKASPRKPTAKKLTVKKAASKPSSKKVVAPKPAPAKKAAAVKAAPAKAAAARKKTVICELSGFEVTPSAPNLSPKTLERLRQKLIEEKQRLLHQADELAAEAEQLARDREAGDTQFDEESGEGDTVNIERERDLLLSSQARQVVEAIDTALTRIKRGTYGVCRYAGRKIPLERLEAIPWADVCVDCKARAERRR